ncbi:MAG: hypothetical protein HYV60_14685 [Planctomycetia bacterium]|nr:hypothetical protein [Planctomycetia bacterium]
MITVTRTGTSVGRVTVTYATEDDTATAGEDYTATTGMLTFESGEMSKTFSVPITIDTTTELEEKLKLKLSTPGGIVRLGTQITAELSITASDFPWQNSRDRLDVNADLSVSAVDVLQIFNKLNELLRSGLGGVLPLPAPSVVVSFYDVNADGSVSPIDALQILNFLNSGGRPSSEAANLHISSDVGSRRLFYPVGPAVADSPVCLSSAKCDRPRPRNVITDVAPAVPAETDAAHRQGGFRLASSPRLHAADDRELIETLFATFDDWLDGNARTNQ